MTTILVDIRPFAAALRAVEHAVDTSMQRPVLATVMIRPHPEGGIELVASDNYRIAVRRVECPVVGEEGWRHLLWVDDLPIIRAFLKAMRFQEQLQIEASGGTITFSCPSQPNSIRVVDFDGQWPNPDPVLEAPATYMTTIDPRYLQQAADTFPHPVTLSLARMGDQRPMALVIEDGARKEVVMSIRSPADAQKEDE